MVEFLEKNGNIFGSYTTIELYLWLREMIFAGTV